MHQDKYVAGDECGLFLFISMGDTLLSPSPATDWLLGPSHSPPECIEEEGTSLSSETLEVPWGDREEGAPHRLGRAGHGRLGNSGIHPRHAA